MSSPSFSIFDVMNNGHNKNWLSGQLGPNEWRYSDIDNPVFAKNWNLPAFSTLYTEESVSYKLNSHNFRCDEFSKLDPTRPIFVVAGCSMTFGTGLPAEDTWGRIVFDRLKKEFPNAQFVNLAIGGTSLDFATRMLASFDDIKRFFDCVVILMPEISRREFSMEDEPVIPFMHVSAENRFDSPVVNQAMKTYSQTLGIDEQNKYNFNKNLCIIDLLSAQYNFNVLIDSWAVYGDLTAKDLAELKYRKYFFSSATNSFFGPVNSSPIINGVPEHKYKGRDGIHPGKFYHQRYADNIYDLVRIKFLQSVLFKGKNLI